MDLDRLRRWYQIPHEFVLEVLVLTDRAYNPRLSRNALYEVFPSWVEAPSDFFTELLQLFRIALCVVAWNS